jgi:proteasome lid subunit RPN8/RPN11/predicted GIY-YIG superfamily endonuclease
MTFWAYMLHCRGGVFYTGHTDDLEHRVGDHKSGLIKGFTSDLLPVELVWSQEFVTRYEALTAERQIKGWSRKKKLALIRGDWDAISRLAKGKSGPSTSSGRTDLGVSRAVIEAMLTHAEQSAPQEACGLLLGEGERITQARPAANIAPDPVRHFEIDPQALVDAHRAARSGGPQVVGYYHSHPAGPAEPSTTDRAQASRDGRVWAIVADGAVRFWRDGDDGFVPLSYVPADG